MSSVSHVIQNSGSISSISTRYGHNLYVQFGTIIFVQLPKVVGKVHDDVPEKLTGNEDAMAYYGVLKPFFEKHDLDESDLESIAADTAIAIHSILESHQKVQFWDDEDAQKQTVAQPLSPHPHSNNPAFFPTCSRINSYSPVDFSHKNEPLPLFTIQTI